MPQQSAVPPFVTVNRFAIANFIVVVVGVGNTVMAGTMFGGAQSREPPKDDDEIQITAMIDVILLLLIFFMITSNLETPSQLSIPPAVNGTAIPVDMSIVISIFKSDADPEIFLSDGTRQNGPADLAQVKSYVQEGVAKTRRNVILKADRDVPSGFVEQVARVASEVDPELKFYVGVMDQSKKQ